MPDTAELRGFVSETLGELATSDNAEATDLRAHPRVLLDTNCNVAETARLLHFHYNTLRYRIGSWSGCSARSPTDADLRLNLALALQVCQMRGI